MHHIPAAVVLLATVVLPVAGYAAKPPPCAPGRFLVAGAPIVSPGRANHDTVVFTGADLSIASGCGPTAFTLKPTKLGTALRAHWGRKSCVALGAAKFTAMIAAPACDAMTGTFSWRGTRGRISKRRFRATRREAVTTCTQGQSTYDVIQERIFGAHGCAVATCHGDNGEGGLSLTAGESYANLVGVAATNAIAAAGTLRVAPGDPANSFLARKLRGTLTPGEGDAMPLVGAPLDAEEIALVEAWIAAGAPATGRVPAAPCLLPQTFHPADALAQPSDGYQLVLDGPDVPPGQEREACIWVATPNPTDFTVGWWEYSMNPGTHHMAVFQWDKPGVPTLNQWNFNDPGCTSGAQFGATLSGAPQAPYFADALPAGLARVLPAGGYLGLNPHYANDFDQPIPVKVWINLHTYDGTPEHLVRTFTDFDDMFTIDVPPATQKLQKGRYTNTGSAPMAIVQLAGHMHKRGVRFSARNSTGLTLFDDFDWAHPYWQRFTPPLILAPGDFIDFECFEDNGVTREQKLDFSGNPVAVKFGLTTDDEMCTLSAAWYPVE